MRIRFEPILFLSGSCRVWVRAQYGTALMDLCLCEGINFCDLCTNEEGEISLRVSLFTCRRLQKRSAEWGIELNVGEVQGLPMLLLRYRRRMGLLIGALLAVFLTAFSSRFVWHVQVTGNVTLDEAEVIRQLRECGFGVGSYIPSLDTAGLENRLLIASSEISWISIYLEGTVARVQIIEFAQTPPDEPIKRPANLVAAADGQIEAVELLRGNCLVSVGQAVKKGELLVSGVYDSATGSFRYTRAAGQVLARTERSFSVEIPLSYVEKVYSTPQKSEIVLHFFNFSVKIFKSSGNLPMSCDIIEETRSYTPTGGYPLPCSLTVAWVYPYEERVTTRTPEAALTLAYEQLSHELASFADDAQILRKEITTTLTDTALVLECKVDCIENIAQQVEFEIVESNAF